MWRAEAYLIKPFGNLSQLLILQPYLVYPPRD